VKTSGNEDFLLNELIEITGVGQFKKVLMVVVVDSSAPEEKLARRRFVTQPSELQRFRIWLQEQGGRRGGHALYSFPQTPKILVDRVQK